MIESPYQPSPDRYDDGMIYRRAGRSGVLLPAFSLGMWHNFGSGQAFSNVQRMAHYAFDRGITHFDLANNYGPAYGTAEENFGRLMERSFRPYRDEMFIATKAGYTTCGRDPTATGDRANTSRRASTRACAA